MEIKQLADLNKYKTAPVLDSSQSKRLSMELDSKLEESDWITIGVMARSDLEAKIALRNFIQKYSLNMFKDFDDLKAMGHVFMKGNQKSGEVYIRSEYGLGEGILITCQYDDLSQNSITYGPFPLSFFSV